MLWGTKALGRNSPSTLRSVYSAEFNVKCVFSHFLIKVTPVQQPATVTLVGEREDVSGNSIRLVRWVVTGLTAKTDTILPCFCENDWITSQRFKAGVFSSKQRRCGRRWIICIMTYFVTKYFSWLMKCVGFSWSQSQLLAGFMHRIRVLAGLPGNKKFHFSCYFSAYLLVGPCISRGKER